MAIRVYLSPVVGDGSDLNPYRPKIADRGVNFAAIMSGGPGGSPRFTWALCACSAADWTAVDADADLSAIPVPLETTIQSLNNPTRNRIQGYLNSRSIPLTVSDYATIGALVEAIGRIQEPTFTLTGFGVRDVG